MIRKNRRKIITCGALTSRKLARLSHAAERMYWRIYMASDNYGTMSADPWDVWHQACPGVVGMDEFVVRDAITELVDAELLQRWAGDEGDEWIHVIGHDKHQAADFIRKRGHRRSPEPPEQVCPEGTIGQGPRPDAVPCPKGTIGHLSTPTSTSISTSASTSPPAPLVPEWTAAQRQQAEQGQQQRRALMAGNTSPAAEAEFVKGIGEKLAGVLLTDPYVVAEALVIKARQPHYQTKMRYELAKWEAAVDMTIAKMKAGWTPEGDLVGYIISLVPSAGVVAEVNPDAIGSDSPDRQLTEHEANARADAAIAAMYGDESEGAS